MPPNRRRTASPDSATLDQLAAPAAGRLRKAEQVDPVLAAGSAPASEPAAPAAAVRRQSAAAAGRAPASTAGKTKVGFYQLPDDTARARAAYDWTRMHERHRSFSDFIAAAVMREVERLEAAYHDGQPWPALEAGELPTGKPHGS